MYVDLPKDEENQEEEPDKGLENVLNDIAEYEQIVKRMRHEKENEAIKNILLM